MSNVRFPYVRAHGREEKGQNQIRPHVRFHGDLGCRSRDHANCKKLKRTFSALPVIASEARQSLIPARDSHATLCSAQIDSGRRLVIAFRLLFALLVIASRHRRRDNLHKDCFTYVRNDKKRHTDRAKASRAYLFSTL